MKCPITGKNCPKHKSFYVEYNSDNHLVCEDCMHSNPEVKPTSQDDPGSCPRCGVTLDQVVRNSRVGCSLCYDHFGEPLAFIIAAVQFGGENRHVGHVPESFKRSSAESVDGIKFATELAQKIKIATREERYEDAAGLANTLREVKSVIESNKGGELDPQKKAELASIVYRHMYPGSA